MTFNLAHARSWGAFLGAALPVLALARWKLLSRQSQISDPLAYVPWAVSTDILICAVAGFFAFLVLRRRPAWIAVTLVFMASLISILFQIKMELPLTVGLLSQVGGFFELQTSLEGVGIPRLLRNVFAMIALFTALAAGLDRIFLRVPQRFAAMGAGIVTLAALCFFLTRQPQMHVYSESLLSSLFGAVQRREKAILADRFFHGLEANSLERENALAVKKKTRPNILVLLIESFDYSFVSDPDRFKRLMPRLHARQSSLARFDRHYAVWPFSTKSLYSTICGDYPLLSTVMQVRVAPEKDCDSWSKRLREEGYAGWAGYSGDFRYDRMGTFLKAQGFETLRDRFDYLQTKPYAAISWGVDDRAVLDSFSSWLDERKTPFMALSIPIDSHHPCWTPDEKHKIFEDSCESSFYYQDVLIEGYFQELEKRGLLKNTIVIVTGDHGRPELRGNAPGTLLENDFHVPLFIHDPTKYFRAGAAAVNAPTSHVGLKGAILKATGLNGSLLKGNDLSGQSAVFLFSLIGMPQFMLLEGSQSHLLNLNERVLYRGGSWVSSLAQPCAEGECQAARSELYRHMRHAGRER